MTDSKGTEMFRSALSATRHPHIWRRYPIASAILALALVACSPKGEALYNRAESSLIKGDARAAVIDLKNLIEDEPQNARARALLGQALVEAGDYQAGEIELQKAKDLGIAPEAILVPGCKIKLAKGEFDAVLADCQPAAAPEKDRAPLHVAQGLALLGLKRAGEARSEFEAALAVEPENLDALLGLASATLVLDGREAVSAVLEAAPEQLRQRSRYWMAVGGLDTEAGDLAGAEQAFKTALEKADKNPTSPERLAALGALAESQLRQRKIEDASATVELLSSAAPDNLFVKQIKGQVEAAAGNLGEARTLLEEVVSKQPGNYQAETLLGIVQMQQGNLGQAEMHFAAVVANQPGNVQAQQLLAEVRSKVQSPQATLSSPRASPDPATADPGMLAMAGRLALDAGDTEQAQSYFAQAAAKLQPDALPATKLEIASGLIRADDLDNAIQILEAMPGTTIGGYQREYLLLLALLRKGDKDRALAEADALVARSGDDPAVRNLVAAVQTAAGDPDAAREQLEDALKLKPDDTNTLLNLARLNLAGGNSAEAEQQYEKVLAKDPKNLAAMLGLSSVSASRKDAAGAEQWLQKATVELPDSVEARLALAQFYLAQKNFEKARAAVDAAAKIAPDNDTVANARGTVQVSAGDLPGAIASFRQAAELAPNAYPYQLNLARAHVLNRDLEAGLAVLDGVLKSSPFYQPALSLAASSCLQAGATDKAAAYIERLQEVAPEAQITHRLEGDLAIRQKRYREALDYYRKAGAKGKDNALVVAEYGAAVQAGVPAPEKILEEWVAGHPEDSNAVALLAAAYEQKGGISRAVSLYERSLQAAPGNPVTLNNLAVLYQRNGDPRALETARKAYDLAPDSAAIQDTYGWILYGQGRFDDAVKVLAEAAEGLPSNSEVLYHYAAALASKGDLGAARAVMNKVNLEQVPDAQRGDAGKLRESLGN